MRASPMRLVSHHGYTKLVRRLRVALPVTAVLVVAGVIAWPHFDPAQAPKPHVDAAPPEMNNSHFSGVDRHARPYTITADKAVQKTNDSNDMDLTRPIAEVTMKNGSWLAVKAARGQYREDAGLIILTGDVQLFHDQGYEVRTEAASVDLDNGLAWSDLPTQGHGPRGDIQGQGFRLYDDGNKIVFLGDSRLVLRNDPQDAGPQASSGAVTP